MKLKVTTKFGCDFCGKSEDEVAALVTGPGDIAICDTCAGIAATHPKSQISSAADLIYPILVTADFI